MGILHSIRVSDTQADVLHAVSSIRTSGLEANKPNESPERVMVYPPEAGPFERGDIELTIGIEKLKTFLEIPKLLSAEPTIMTKPTLVAVLMEVHESEIHAEEESDENDSRSCMELPCIPIDAPKICATFEPVVAAEPGRAKITFIPSYEANLLMSNGSTPVSNFENDKMIGKAFLAPLNDLLKMEESEIHFEKMLHDFPIDTLWVNPNDAKFLPSVMATPPVAGEFVPLVFATSGVL